MINKFFWIISRYGLLVVSNRIKVIEYGVMGVVDVEVRLKFKRLDDLGLCVKGEVKRIKIKNFKDGLEVKVLIRYGYKV